jgi:hypothetical protein
MNQKAIKKANELVDRMYHYQWREKERAKECALIAVGEMLEILYESPAKNIKEIAFCIDVTNEIKKL